MWQIGKKVESVAKSLMHDFIMETEQGYESFVGNQAIN